MPLKTGKPERLRLNDRNIGKMTKKQKIAVAAAAPAAMILIIIFREQILWIGKHFGICVFHTVTGLWCPGCGNTRSVTALLHGDILLAVRNNASLPFIGLLLICLYAELIFDICGKKVKLLPRKLWVWLVVIALFAVYFVLRNFIPEIAPV